MQLQQDIKQVNKSPRKKSGPKNEKNSVQNTTNEAFYEFEIYQLNECNLSSTSLVFS